MTGQENTCFLHEKKMTKQLWVSTTEIVTCMLKWRVHQSEINIRFCFKTIFSLGKKPSFSRRVVNITTLHGTRVVIIDCIPNGFPTPNVTWTRSNGQPLQIWDLEFQLANGSLVLAKATKSAMFDCNADNGVGKAVLTAIVTVTGKTWLVNVECHIDDQHACHHSTSGHPSTELFCELTEA